MNNSVFIEKKWCTYSKKSTQYCVKIYEDSEYNFYFKNVKGNWPFNFVYILSAGKMQKNASHFALCSCHCIMEMDS